MSTSALQEPVAAGRLLRIERISEGFSLKDAAQLLNCSSNNLAKSERGESDFSVPWAITFSDKIIKEVDDKVKFRNLMFQMFWPNPHSAVKNWNINCDFGDELFNLKYDLYLNSNVERNLFTVRRSVRKYFLFPTTAGTIEALQLLSHWHMVLGQFERARFIAKESAWIAKSINDQLGFAWAKFRMIVCDRLSADFQELQIEDSLNRLYAFERTLLSEGFFKQDNIRTKTLENAIQKEKTAAIISICLARGGLECPRALESRLREAVEGVRLTSQKLTRVSRVNRSKDYELQASVLLGDIDMIEGLGLLPSLCETNSNLESVPGKLSRLRTEAIVCRKLGHPSKVRQSIKQGRDLAEEFGFKLAQIGFGRLSELFGMKSH